MSTVSFGLVVILGFMPLAVVHWADQQRLHVRWRTVAKWANITKTGLLLALTDRLVNIAW
ncbi:MAG: hypothetical protein JXQ72_05445 [Anaerolineae bacterium]|nr:hypothetical protein [Anaerolineae bacterium]